MLNINSLGITVKAICAALLVGSGTLALAQPETDAATAAAQRDLWQRLRAGLQLNHLEHERIEVERNWYERNPDYMLRVSRRAQRYLFYVVEQVEARGMPMELALLPIMESAYDPFAYSHGRAAGIWQIIPGTGEELGLTQDWWYDGRRDLRASTAGALDYLEKLSAAFDGDWLKALASYNAGKRRVNDSIRANRKRDRPTDFWSLKLPAETRSYVPRLLALSQIFAEPDRFGIALTPVSDTPYFGIAPTGGQIDLAQAADLSGLDIEALYLLNPGFNRWATAPDGPHELLLPIAALANFNAGLESMPAAERISWQRYIIRSGDSLSVIARRFNTGSDVIREVNGIKGNQIRAGDVLLIPTASEPPSTYALSAQQRTQRRQNGGDEEVRLNYKVQAGDSFWSIANEYGVTSRQLAQWNGLAVRDPIRPGQKLVIRGVAPEAQTAAEPVALIGPLSREPMMRKLGYRVRNGDSLALIADKFDLTIEDIIGWNSSLQGKKYIHPGQVLTLYVDVRGG
ncbi:LysM peptidoglycan-binding domain-containing protein [Halieaceae bacterium IMCC14734]|uniref:LysM peptidoglycan-binding domain-containing protein n=1 Tax=Candidatus Litorirhabdus singularis TaxID=2518993 RepID=A0ABT3TGB0_9GAMM|nr:LysM peptidoglycan-binding domain-containing protein [Candidatus Litorirhabdus singularis]MCX2981340.1 LysM peptidoglycan-binding domain-containing protein [Candidatus Litorirhabdus singularis]